MTTETTNSPTRAARLDSTTKRSRIQRHGDDLASATRHHRFLSEDRSLDVDVAVHGNEYLASGDGLVWTTVEIDARAENNAGRFEAANAWDGSVWIYLGQASVRLTQEQANALAASLADLG